MPEKKKIFMDSEVTDSYVSDTKTIAAAIQAAAGKSPFESHFEGGRSPEFYKGMLAGAKAYMAILNVMAPENFEEFSNILLDLHRCIVDKID